MTGFELKFGDKCLLLPLEAVITITRRKKRNEDEEISIYVGLYDPVFHNAVNWLKSELGLDDEIVVNVKDVEQFTEPVEVFNIYENMNTTKEDTDKRALEEFLILREELGYENPGTIPAE